MLQINMISAENAGVLKKIQKKKRDLCRKEKWDIANISFAKKKEETVSGLNSEVKKKILKTVIWYGQVDDENNVSLAREHGEVLYELLKEVPTL